MNQNYFFDQFLLMYLYKKGTADTNEIETAFGDAGDGQNVNNVISNRYNSTSYINQGYIDYDEASQTLSITPSGRRVVETQFSGKRG